MVKLFGKNKFYSLDRILKEKAVYSMVFGERSNGKTYAVLKYAVADYVKTGGTFAYIRRWKEDVTGSRASSVFSALNANGEIKKLTNGEYDCIVYNASKFYLATYNEDGKAIYNDSDLFGYTFALSDSEHNKSISYPDVRTILFDEFLTKHTYLTDEFVLFMNTISTIVRQRTDVKIFMLGNTINKYSPYFTEMGLNHVQEMKQGTIDIYKYGESGLSVAVEYAESTAKNKENNFYFAFNNPKLEMITGGSWELDIYPHNPIKYKPKHIMFTYFIIFNNNIYQAEIVYKDNFTFTFIHEKTTPIQNEDTDIVYSLDYVPKINYNRSIYKPENKIQQKILWYFTNERVYYQDNNVGNAIANYLKESR